MTKAFSFIIVLLLFASCKKDSMYMDSATITGFDPRMGICEGGIFIKIDGHSNPNNLNGLYDIDSLPASFKIDNTTSFPIRVTINWKVENKCSGNYISISQIKRIN